MARLRRTGTASPIALLVVCAAWSVAAAEAPEGAPAIQWGVSPGPILPELSPEADAALKPFREATRYPAKPDLAQPIAGYDYRRWFETLLAPNVLPAGWTEHVARQPRWARATGAAADAPLLDALLVRYRTDSQIVHITDTRADLILAVRRLQDAPWWGAVDGLLDRILPQYLARGLAGKREVRYYTTDGGRELAYGLLLPADAVPPASPPVESISFIVSREFAVFAFRKNYGGALPGWGVTRPLFTAQETVSDNVTALRTLLERDSWTGRKFVERVLAVRRELPEDPAELQRRAEKGDPAVRAAADALDSAYRALDGRLRRISRQEKPAPGSYELCASALEVPDGLFLLEVQTSTARRRAVAAAPAVGDERLLPMLMELVKSSPDESLRSAAVEAVSHIAADGGTKLLWPLLKEADLDDAKDAERARQIVSVLAGHPDAGLMDFVERVAAGAKQADLRYAAVQYATALGRATNDEQTRGRCTQAVRGRLAEPDSGVRMLAARSAGQLRDPLAVPALMGMAAQEDELDRRLEAARAIASIRGWPFTTYSASTDEEKEAAVQAVLARVADDRAP